MTRLELIQSQAPWQWPPEARQVFLKALVDKSTPAADRVIAAELAGDLIVISDDIANLLAAIASDPAEPEQLRAKSATSLGGILEYCDTCDFDDPDDVYISEDTFEYLRETVHNIYLDASNPKLLRRRALEVAVRAPEDWVNAPIAEAFATRDPEWVLTAVFCMQFVTGFDSQALESLDSPDPFVREYSVTACGHARIQAAWPFIEALLSDSETPKSILLAAIDAASEIRPEDSLELLEELVDSDDEDISQAAEEAIQMAEFQVEDEADSDEDDELGEDIELGGWRH